MPEGRGGASGSGPVGAAAIGLAGFLSLAVAMGIGRFSFTPMLPLMIQDGGLDVAGGGWVAAANYLGYLLGALSAGRLPLAPPRLAAGALLLTAALAAAMALPLGTAGWAVLRLVAGMASAWAFVATSVWCLQALATRAPADPRAAAWSTLLYAGVGTGITLSGLYCLVSAGAGSRAAPLWLQLAGLALLLMLPALRVIARLRGEVRAPVPPAHGAAAGPALPPGSRTVVWAYGLFGFGYILPATFLPVLARELVPDPRLFGLAWPLFGLMAAASALAAAWALRRASRLQVWAVAQALMGLGTLLPALWLSGWTIGLSAVLVGGTFIVTTLAGVQEMRQRAGPGAPRALARMTTAFALGQIAGPVAANLLRQVPGLGPARALDAALVLGAASLLATAWALWREGRPGGPARG